MLMSSVFIFQGDYWIDPNQGDAKDAILAYCDMHERTTCIYPKPSEVSRCCCDF